MNTRSQNRNSIAIDSGASTHMLRNKDMFSSLKKCHMRTITMADERTMSARQMGSVFIPSATRYRSAMSLELKNPLFIPMLKRNLLSVPKLDAEGYDVSFGKELCTIARDGHNIC